MKGLAKSSLPARQPDLLVAEASKRERQVCAPELLPI